MSQIGSLNTFTSGTTITSADVNANFADIKTAANDTDTKVTSLLSGNLTVSGNKVYSGTITFNNAVTCLTAATTGNHLTNKTYVDTATALLLPKAGGTMTGKITLDGDPSNVLHAATKQYVDAVDTVIDNHIADSSAAHAATAVSFSAGGSISATDVQAAIDELDATISALTSDDIAEGSSLYFTDERAQDAVGGILTDSSTIDFTYTDGSNTITAAVIEAGLTLSNLGGVLSIAKGGTSVSLLGGATGSRPGSPSIGNTYYDSTLGKLIVYNGAAWVNVDGTSL